MVQPYLRRSPPVEVNMKKNPGQQTPVWLKALKQLKIDPSKLALHELGAFRDVESFLREPIPGPVPWQYLNRCFRYLTAFALMTIHMKTHPPLSRCWNDVSAQ